MAFQRAFSWLLAFTAYVQIVKSTALLLERQSTASPAVDLGYSQYQGTFNETSNVTSFLGIRYAASPTGTLRFDAPQSPSPTSGVQQATATPAECMQAGAGASGTTPFRSQTGNIAKRAATASEDCLFLSVYSPGTLNPDSKLPVMVWIHGGGYVGGSEGIYPGQDLVEESGYGVIAVTIQYRLGVFGFLPGTQVKEGGALNAGLLDEEFALQWVQQYIGLFGGDPTQVTIWGQSAGAGSVLQQAIAHGGNTEPPLFRAAITSSTFLPSQYLYNDTIPETLYSEVVSQANCSSAEDTLDCLRQTDVNTLQTINVNLNAAGFYGTFVFVPVVDGTFITERPTVTMSQGRVNGDVLLANTNSYEGTSFVDLINVSNITDYVTQLFPLFQIEQIEAAVAQYANLGTPVQQAVAVMGESIFICPAYYLLSAFEGKAGYKGEFAVPTGYHGEDVPYYFPDNTAIGGSRAFNNPDFVEAFIEPFFSIAKYMTPNYKDTPTIAPYLTPWLIEHSEMLFNRTDDYQPVVQTITTDTALLERCAFWQSVSNLTAQ